MKRFRASADDVLAVLLPQPRVAGDDRLTPASRSRSLLAPDIERPAPGFLVARPAAAAAVVAPVATGLPADIERRLAALAGVDTVPEWHEPSPDPVAFAGGGDFAQRLLRVAQFVTVGAFVLLAVAALLAAEFGTGTLRVHELPLAGWGFGAALAALALAGVERDGRTPLHRRTLGPLLLAALLACVTGAVANADGVAGPAWVLFLPVVLVTGAVLGPALGLLVGATAAGGVYTAAGLSHTLTIAGLGRLVVLLPAFPAAGWAAGALCALAREAAESAERRRAALERDVSALSALLAEVADGDLSRVPAPGGDADPVATSLAVVFADTLLALRRLVRQLGNVADQIAGSATDLAGTAEQHVSAVESQVAAVNETTTTIEQLAATAGSIAETAIRVSQFAGATRRDVDAGAGAVQDATLAMDHIAQRVNDLAERSETLRERIGAIGTTSHVIDELARQTTILAVNASIEAARAGEHGHGFATVAAEVGTLANRAREATARISTIVAELEREAAATAEASREGHAAVEEGALLQQDVVTALRRIASMVDRTTAASREITEATRQQRAASDAVVAAMTRVTGVSDRYRDGTRHHAAAASRLRDLSAGLRATIGRFKIT